MSVLAVVSVGILFLIMMLQAGVYFVELGTMRDGKAMRIIRLLLIVYIVAMTSTYSTYMDNPYYLSFVILVDLFFILMLIMDIMDKKEPTVGFPFVVKLISLTLIGIQVLSATSFIIS